jgi:sugar porter (SP) family MFS transporter
MIQQVLAGEGPTSAAVTAAALLNANDESSASASSRSSRFSPIGVLLIFIVPALGGLLFGYDIGATSYVIVQVASPFAVSGVEWGKRVASSAIWQGCIVSFASLGALMGSCAMFGLADQLGRRRELRIGAILYLMGAAAQGVSSFLKASSWPWGLVVLLTGRLVYGLGIGISMHAAPTYLGEMGPSQIRGLLVTLKEAAIVLGMLLGYSVGYYNSTIPGGWAYTYATSAFFSVAMLALSFTIPRSSRWLLKHGLQDEALRSLRFVFIGEDADREFLAMRQLHQAAMNAAAEQPPASILGTLRLLWKVPSYRAPLVTGVGLVVLQQVTGQPSVLSYAAPIFAQAGLSSASSILVAAFKLLATLVAAFTVENFGRKKLLYTGCSLMLVALICLAVSFNDKYDTNKMVETLIFISMFVYIGGYQGE